MVCVILISTTGTEKRFVFPVFRIEVLTDWTYLTGKIRNNFQEIIPFPVQRRQERFLEFSSGKYGKHPIGMSAFSELFDIQFFHNSQGIRTQIFHIGLYGVLDLLVKQVIVMTFLPVRHIHCPYHMFQTVGCNMQFGGDDQWSNMLGGTELIRRKLGKDAHAMTITLLTDSQGNKMGKTAGNAVWLDPNKTSPFEFYQYWRNIDDADVLKCIRMLTFLPLEQIDAMADWEGAKLNEAKDILAYELTKLVHGEDEAEKARQASKALFSGAGDTEHMPTTELTNDDFGGGAIDVLTLLVKCGLAASKGEARRLVQQGGITVGDKKVDSIDASFGCQEFTGDGLIIRKGKKVFHRAVLI